MKLEEFRWSLQTLLEETYRRPHEVARVIEDNSFRLYPKPFVPPPGRGWSYVNALREEHVPVKGFEQRKPYGFLVLASRGMPVDVTRSLADKPTDKIKRRGKKRRMKLHKRPKGGRK